MLSSVQLIQCEVFSLTNLTDNVVNTRQHESRFIDEQIGIHKIHHTTIKTTCKSSGPTNLLEFSLA
jgi:hypothetical protein